MDLTFAHFIALLPLLVTTGTAIAVMLLIAWKRNHRIAYIASVAGLLLALLSIQPALEAAPLDVTALLRMDAFGRIENWPKHFFGDAIGETERMTRRMIERMRPVPAGAPRA